MNQTRLGRPNQGPTRFVLTPHRSLSPAGFTALMVLFGATCFVTGILFLAIGAWPVLGFFGLDVLLLYVAFRLNYRAGRAYELVELRDGELSVTRVDARGRSERLGLNSYWARVDLRRHPDGSNELRLAAQGREAVVGRFLSNEDREALSVALREALLAARGGARI